MDESAHFAGLDVGGTTVKAALLNGTGNKSVKALSCDLTEVKVTDYVQAIASCSRNNLLR